MQLYQNFHEQLIKNWRIINQKNFRYKGLLLPVKHWKILNFVVTGCFSTFWWKVQKLKLATIYYYYLAHVFSIGSFQIFKLSIGSFLYSLFSNILDFFQIKQCIQAETYSETCRASKMVRFAKLGSGCYENT